MSDFRQDLHKTWARVVVKAWADDEFKRRLLADPRAIAGEEGVPIPEGQIVKVIEDEPGTRTLVLPPPPAQIVASIEMEERIPAIMQDPDDGPSPEPGYYNTAYCT